MHFRILADEEASFFEDGSRILQCSPNVVFVKMFDKDGKDLPWTLPGLDEPGLYPIVPCCGTWYMCLDKGRAQPVLKICCRQLPLTPALL